MKPIVAILLTAALLLSCMSALAVEGEDLAVQMVDKSAYLEQVSTRRCTFQCKYINNDQVLIDSNERTYTVQGNEVK